MPYLWAWSRVPPEEGLWTEARPGEDLGSGPQCEDDKFTPTVTRLVPEHCKFVCFNVEALNLFNHNRL